MPRSQVIHNPGVSCSVGLHAATYAFAKSFVGAGGPVLKIFVNPRDVVSVPSYGADKFRCCRYTVGGVVSEAYQVPFIFTDDLFDDDYFDEDEYDGYYYAGSN
jgi:hypothetical protein